ncbi:DUF5011 domain-containing protein [Planococcus sp. APC 3906]|uniref:immunoglobulin-like domain-containing protein n=1 Tax=Planococcus sp. APC 3906 TaxID=3035194 RepID=UPI0025B4D6F0|nr:immunoglobulin-like domain-containing protein [Planococcus sp. APC 3906]MDN3450069.1 DUF5011 domain-containing protein [Planococcus sp. APC 3906]
MKIYLKILSLLIVAGLMISILPERYIDQANAEPLLTFETARKYKGIIAANESRISILQANGSVSETSMSWEQEFIEWKNIKFLDASTYFTVGLTDEGTVITSDGYPYISEEVSNWKDIEAISVGESDLLALNNNGTVLSAGNGDWDISSWTDIISIAAGMDHYVGLKKDGTILANGSYPTSFAEASNWKAIIEISVGDNHTAGLREDGTVLATGEFAEEVKEWNNIVAISSGDYHLVGLKSDGTLVGSKTGYNDSGQLDFKDWENVIAVQAEGYYTIGLKSDGTIISTGNIYGAQRDIAGWTNIRAISAGEKNITALKKDGSVLSEGSITANFNSLSDWSDISQISVGAIHTLGLKSNGTVLGAGNSGNGQINVEKWTNIKQVSAGEAFSIGLKNDGTVLATGYGYGGRTNVQSWSGIVKVFTGSDFTLGLKEDGTIVDTRTSTEFNSKGWSGIKDIAGGLEYITGLKNDGTVLAEGRNRDGQLDVKRWEEIKAIAAGRAHTVGLKTDGTVVATGSNAFGQTEVENWTDIVAVSAGDDFTAGLKSDGTIVATSWTGQAASDAIAIDKQVVKPGDNVQFSLSSSRFYTIESDEYTFSGSISLGGHLNSVDGKEYKASYQAKEADVGWVNISLPGIVDSFGNSLQRKNLFQVVPLQSLTSSIKDAKSGEKVTLTASFYQPVQPDFELSLAGAVKMDPVLMKEVAGSGGKKFIFQYTLPADYEEGAVSASLQNISTLDEKRFDPYIEEHLFVKSNDPAPLSALFASQKQAKVGDIVTITAKFSEKVAGGIKLSLDGGANLQDQVMIEVPGSAGQEFTYDYYVYGGNPGGVTASLTNVFDANGTLRREYKQENLFIADAELPQVENFETSQIKAKLGEKLVFTATFSEPVKPGVKVNLSGGTENKALEMDEIPESNGLKYKAEYTIGEKDSGTVHAEIINLEDFFGNQSVYFKNDLFYADGKTPTLISIQSDEKVHYQGDYAHIIAEFSEPVKPDMKIKFSGAIKGEEYTMSEVANSQGKKFELFYEVKSDQHRFVDVDLVDIEDMAGNITSVSSRKLFYISDPSNAQLNDLSVQGFNFSQTFSPDVTEYEVTVPDSLKTIEIQANAEDPDAVVSGAGNVTLAPGDNSYTITVTSKDGTKKEYHLNVKAVDLDHPLLEGVADVIIKVGESFNNRAGITAIDVVDGDLTNSIYITGAVDTAKPGVYYLEYTAADKNGNSITAKRKITVVDDQKPSILGAKDLSVLLNSAFDPKAGIKAEDNVDGNLTTSIQISGTVNTKVVGIYPVKYSITDASGNQSSMTVNITVTLPSPSGLKAVSNSIDSIKITWGAVSGATGYEVYRSTSSTGTYSRIGPTTSYNGLVDPDVPTNKTYYYKVRAYQYTGSAKFYSGYSTVISGKALPPVPTSVKVASASYNSIKVSWAAIWGATGYEVYRSTSSTGTYSSVGSTASTSLVNGNLVTGNTYYYKVRSYRTVEGVKVYSSFSSIFNAKPVFTGTITARAASAGYSKNKVSWSQVSGASGYIVYRATSKTGTYSNIKTITSGSTLVYENTGLTTGKTYYYKVRAYRVVSGKNVYGLYSGIVSAIPTLAMPSKITLAKVSSTSIKSSWSKVGEASGYELYRATSKAGTYTKVKTQTSGSAITFTNTGLSKGKTYYYKVRAYRIVNGKKIYSTYTPIVSSTL